jgi:hypothetical protein
MMKNIIDKIDRFIFIILLLIEKKSINKVKRIFLRYEMNKYEIDYLCSGKRQDLENFKKAELEFNQLK